MPEGLTQPHVEVWLLRLSQISTFTDQQLTAGLSKEELLRASDMQSVKATPSRQHNSQRRQFLATRWLARQLLRHCLLATSPPIDSDIVITARGRPIVSSHPQFKLTISHSGDYVVVGCSQLTNTDIGVDIEVPKQRNTLALASHFFHPEEVRWLTMQPQNNAFYRLWTAKEAYLKASNNDNLLSTLRKIYFPYSNLCEARAPLPGYLYHSKIEGIPLSLCLLTPLEKAPSVTILNYIEQHYFSVASLKLSHD